MSVRVAEVAGVDPPRPVVRLVRESCAGRFGSAEQSVDVRLVLDDVSDAELSCPRCADRDVGVLCQLGARVESQDEAVIEVEHDDCAGSGVVAALVFGADHTARAETESIAIEGERAFQVVHREREHVDAGFHRVR